MFHVALNLQMRQIMATSGACVKEIATVLIKQCSRRSKTLLLLDVNHFDATGGAVLTLWLDATTHQFTVGQVISLSRAKVDVYFNRSLSATSSAVFDMHPTSE